MNKDNKESKIHTSTRRQLLKKLSYSPPMLLCLGTLTRPTVGWATHESGRTQPLMGGDPDGDYTTVSLSDFFFDQSEEGRPFSRPDRLNDSLELIRARDAALADWRARHGH